MCMTFGNSLPGLGSFIATDLRRGIIQRRSDGAILSNGYDGGGRLVETPLGWATATGGESAGDLALNTLRIASLEAVLPALVSAGYSPARELPNERSALGPLGHTIVTYSSDEAIQDANRIALMTIGCDAPGSVTLSNGRLTDTHSGGVHVTLPCDQTREDLAALIHRACREFPWLHSLAARIKVAAGYFSEVSLRSPMVSREIEIGYILVTPDGPMRGFLRGHASEIAATEPSQIFERFGAVRAASFNPQGSVLPSTMAALPISYNAGGPATNRMWIAFTWSSITLYRPDGSTVTIPASSSFATPPSPTLSQVAAGALGARTLYCRIGYIKNHMIVRVGAEGSFAVSANNVLKVTSPASVSGYDGWIALVGSASNSEYAQTETPFGSDWTESVGGFNSTTTSPYDNATWPSAVIARELPASTLLYYYPYYDIAFAAVAFTGRGTTAKSETDAYSQNADGRNPLSFGGATVTSPAGGATGSGTVTNSGGRLL